MYATLTREEEKACELLGVDKDEFRKARQREIDSLSDIEKQVSEKMGVNPIDYLKIKKREDEERRALQALSSDELKICQGTGKDFVEFYKEKTARC